MMNRLLLLSIIAIVILSPVTDVVAQTETATEVMEEEVTEVVTETMEEEPEPTNGMTTMPLEEPIITTLPVEVTTAASEGGTESNGNSGDDTTTGADGNNNNGNNNGNGATTTVQSNGGDATTAASSNGGNGDSGSPVVKFTLSSIAITNPDDAVFSFGTGQNVDVDVSIVLQSGSGAVSGDSNWQMIIGLTNGSLSSLSDPDVGTIAFGSAVFEPTTDVGVDLVAGGTYTFSTTTTFSLANVTDCRYSHLCVLAYPHEDANWSPDYDASVPYRCTQVYCTGVSLKLHLVLVAAVMAVHALHKSAFCS